MFVENKIGEDIWIFWVVILRSTIKTISHNKPNQAVKRKTHPNARGLKKFLLAPNFES